MKEKRIKRIERLAWVLDSAIAVPGTSYRIGLDPLIGLIPGLGDVVGMLISLYLLAEAMALGSRKRELAQMLGWIVADSAIGLIPIAGDLFDFGFKSNQKIVKLLRDRHGSSQI